MRVVSAPLWWLRESEAQPYFAAIRIYCAQLHLKPKSFLEPSVYAYVSQYVQYILSYGRPWVVATYLVYGAPLPSSSHIRLTPVKAHTSVTEAMAFRCILDQ
jgi:hypothetical protein